MSRPRRLTTALTAIVAAAAALTTAALTSALPATASPTASSHGPRTHGNPYDAVHTAHPYLGWSSWSLQAVHDTTLNPRGDYSWLTEQNILTQAKALATTLKPAGYDYINIDAGWWRQWDWTPEYDSHGRYAVDAARFPDGLQYVIDKIHAMGLKVGIYVPVGMEKGAYDNGDFPIAGAPGCTTHDAVYDDLRTTNGWDSSYKLDFSKPCAQAWINSETAEFSKWGIDFLKIDGVGPGSNRSGADYDNRDEIAAWDKGFARAHHRVVIQLSWALSNTYAQDWSQLADSRRVENDVECYCSTITKWSAIAKRFTDVVPWLAYAGRGKGWNNLDSLDIGNGAADGLTLAERQSAMTLWAIEAAPLYSGDDLTTLDAAGKRMLTNREVIAIDQAGNPARPVSQATDQQVWFSRNRDGSWTVALFNLGSAAAPVTASWSDLGIHSPVSLHDDWSHTSRGTSSGSWTTTVPAHGSVLLTVRPGRGHH